MHRATTPVSNDDLSVKGKENVFWTKIICGMTFGFSSYFVTRFTAAPWYLLILVFFVPTMIISTFVIWRKAQVLGVEISIAEAMKSAFDFTGSWLMAYIAFVTLAYFVGW
ncbi:MAG: hypothetical protein R6V83_07625 [Candidatus Thorarchaeota archaeon]